MTQIALAISVAATSQEPNEKCWFCEEKSNHKVTDIDADPETNDSDSEDDVPENDEKNDASKLGSNLGSQPSWTITCPEQEIETKVMAAAHHCIPGNASLKKCKNLLKYMKEGQSPVNLSGDIGYGINHKKNGVWLPGNYNVRSGKEHYKKNWGAYTGVSGDKFKNNYAIESMKKSGLQFHDAHPAYSENVLDTLTDIVRKLGKPKDTCPICEKKLDKTRPPYGLVGRLDFVSGEHRTMITTMGKKRGKKFVESGYFTSSRVKKYFGL